MLDKNGFVRKSYDELVYDLSQKAKELFGSDINLSGHSVIGAFIRLIAWFLALLYELIERVYLSGFISQASGVSLDRLGGNVGVTRNPESAAMVELSFTGKENYVITEGVRFSTESKIMFEMIDEVRLAADGTGKGYAVSLEANAKANVAANTIIVQVEPTEEVFSVVNLHPASGGAEIETDKDFRERIRMSLRGSPGPPVNGLLTALLNVSGVQTARLVENNLMEVDEYGNPPKSIHIYVLGGERESVGQAIFESVAAGVLTVGNQRVLVADQGGHPHEVRFDYSGSIELYVRVRVRKNNNFPADGINQIKSAVAKYMSTVNMGGTVRHTYLYSYIYQVAGIDVAVVEIGTKAGQLAPADITLNPFESASIPDKNIEVILE